MQEKLTVIAEIKARPGMEEKVRKALLALVPPTHAEEGCLDYDLHESLDEKGLFYFYENWTEDSALGRHLESSHLKALPGQIEGCLAAPVKIVRCRRLHEPKPALSPK